MANSFRPYCLYQAYLLPSRRASGYPKDIWPSSWKRW